MSHSTRPFNSNGMDAAMSDRRVLALTLTVDRENRSHAARDVVTIRVWSRSCPNAQAPDYRAYRLTGTGYELDVHMADGRTLSMPAYLRWEAANAVRQSREERRAARLARRMAATPGAGIAFPAAAVAA